MNRYDRMGKHPVVIRVSVDDWQIGHINLPNCKSRDEAKKQAMEVIIAIERMLGQNEPVPGT